MANGPLHTNIAIRTASLHVLKQQLGLPVHVIPRGAKGVAGAPAHWPIVRAPHAGRPRTQGGS